MKKYYTEGRVWESTIPLRNAIVEEAKHRLVAPVIRWAENGCLSVVTSHKEAERYSGSGEVFRCAESALQILYSYGSVHNLQQ